MSLDHAAGFGKLQKVTDDAFLGGKLMISQPSGGFRAGSDSVLLGAGISPDSRSILDLGAGAGVAGLTALIHNTEAEGTFAEIDAEMANLGQHNADRNGLKNRSTVITCDVAASGAIREAAGLRRDYYTSVVANPPFFETRAGTRAADSKRAKARHMPLEELDNWVRTAAASVAPKGEIIFINRAELLSEMLAAFVARVGGITVLPLLPRPGAEAGRVLVRGIKGSRAPLTLLAPLVLHDQTGDSFQPRVAAILQGKDRLHW